MNNFALFLPYLEEIIGWQKKFIQYWGIKNGSPYNTLLDLYEPDMTTDVLDKVFGELRETIVSLVQKSQIHQINQIQVYYLSISLVNLSVHYH